MAVVDDESIALIQQGVAGLMRHLGMRTDGPPPVATPVWIKQNEVLRASQTGLFSASVKKGERVTKGREDRHGHRLPRQRH